MEPAKQDMMDAILDSNRNKAVELAKAWARDHGFPSVFSELLDPVLAQIGVDYEKGQSATLAYGYIAAKVAEDILGIAAIEAPPPATGVRKAVIIGNIEDDYHALGRKMVGVFLRTAGWDVHDLGNDVPAEGFVNTALEKQARVIGVSAMMHTTARNIAKVRNELDRRGLSGKIQLAVGGAIFCIRPELVSEVGGDGTARNAFLAAELISQLHQRSLSLEATS